MLSSVLRSKVIKPQQYVQLLKEPLECRVIPIDGSWFLNPAAQSNGKSGYECYLSERVPGARFFDVDGVKDTNSPYPHMLPTKEVFDKAMSDLGLRRDDLLVVYDAIGNFSAPRALWMLRAFQHEKAVLLDNFPLYKKEGLPLESGEPEKVEPSDYKSPGIDPEMVIAYEDLREIVCDNDKKSQYNMLDARPKVRFDGKDPEPRPGVKSGHVPGAVSLPFPQVLNPDTKEFKSPEELKKIFSEVSSPDKQTIVMCGSGVTACVLENALRVSGEDKKIRVYDGSWSEWGQRADDNLVAKSD